MGFSLSGDTLRQPCGMRSAVDANSASGCALHATFCQFPLAALH